MVYGLFWFISTERQSLPVYIQTEDGYSQDGRRRGRRDVKWKTFSLDFLVSFLTCCRASGFFEPPDRSNVDGLQGVCGPSGVFSLVDLSSFMQLRCRVFSCVSLRLCRTPSLMPQPAGIDQASLSFSTFLCRYF